MRWDTVVQGALSGGQGGVILAKCTAMQNDPQGEGRNASSGTDSPVERPSEQPRPVAAPPVEIGGPPGPEPTRFGDWEKNGRCIDF